MFLILVKDWTHWPWMHSDSTMKLTGFLPCGRRYQNIHRSVKVRGATISHKETVLTVKYKAFKRMDERCHESIPRLHYWTDLHSTSQKWFSVELLTGCISITSGMWKSKKEKSCQLRLQGSDALMRWVPMHRYHRSISQNILPTSSCDMQGSHDQVT